MRLRIRELMANHKPPVKTAYALAQLSGKKIPITTAQRLVSTDGRLLRIDMSTLDALCETLGCKPSELLGRD